VTRSESLPRSAHHVWPAERFYWAVIESAPAGRRDGAFNNRLFDGLLDEQVPANVVGLHAVYLTTHGDRLLACAAKRAELDALPEDATSLRPASVPAFAESLAPPDAASRINLLQGPYEPRPVRRERERRTNVVLPALVGTFALAGVGFARRASADKAFAADARASAVSVLGACAELLDAPTDITIGEIRDRVREFRLTRSRPDSAPRDAAGCLTGLLAGWPTVDGAQTQSLRVDSSGAHIVVHAPDIDAARAFASGVAAPPGLARGEPQVDASASGAVLRLRLAHQPEAAP